MPKINIHMHLTGFEKLKNVINPVRFNRELKKRMRKYNSKLGQMGRKKVKRAIRLQSPWEPNSPFTIAKKGHRKTLIEWGIMLRSTGYTIEKNGFSVGVKKLSDDGKYNVAQIVHDGAMITLPDNVTPAIIPPRPFLTYALFEEKVKMSDVTNPWKYDSHFMHLVKVSWMLAVDEAFVSGGRPVKHTRPKK